MSYLLLEIDCKYAVVTMLLQRNYPEVIPF